MHLCVRARTHIHVGVYFNYAEQSLLESSVTTMEYTLLWESLAWFIFSRRFKF